MIAPERIAWSLSEVAKMLGYTSGRTIARALARHPQVPILGVGRSRRIDAAGIAALVEALKSENDAGRQHAAHGSSVGLSQLAVSRKLAKRREELEKLKGRRRLRSQKPSNSKNTDRDNA